jgi:hypothetical protein
LHQTTQKNSKEEKKEKPTDKAKPEVQLYVNACHLHAKMSKVNGANAIFRRLPCSGRLVCAFNLWILHL